MKHQMLLLVDENDNFTGEYATKEECHAGNGKHHRAFVLLILNKEKKILLQKRKHERWDNYWDLTAASHPLHLEDRDETYEEAGNRCLKIEWGFSTELKSILAFNYFENYNGQCENEYCTLLFGQYDGELNPNKENAYGYKWIDLKELSDDISKNEKSYTPWAVIAIKKFSEHPFSSQLL